MDDIDPSTIFAAYGNEDIWCDGNTNTSFKQLYQDGYRYITHYDNKYKTLYKIDDDGKWYCVYNTDYDKIMASYSGEPLKLNNVQEVLASLHGSKSKVFWKVGPTQTFEIKIDDPIYTLLYTSLPSQTILFNFYEEKK